MSRSQKRGAEHPHPPRLLRLQPVTNVRLLRRTLLNQEDGSGADGRIHLLNESKLIQHLLLGRRFHPERLMWGERALLFLPPLFFMLLTFLRFQLLAAIHSFSSECSCLSSGAVKTQTTEAEGTGAESGAETLKSWSRQFEPGGRNGHMNLETFQILFKWYKTRLRNR